MNFLGVAAMKTVTPKKMFKRIVSDSYRFRSSIILFAFPMLLSMLSGGRIETGTLIPIT